MNVRIPLLGLSDLLDVRQLPALVVEIFLPVRLFRDLPQRFCNFQLLKVGGRKLRRRKVDLQLVNRPGETEGGLVQIAHRRTSIFARIERFIRGESTRNSLLDAPSCSLLVVDEKCRRSTLADTAAVVLELHAQIMLTRCERLGRGHLVAFHGEVVVFVSGLTVFNEQGIASHVATGCD